MGRTKIDRNAQQKGIPVKEYLSDLYNQHGSQVKVAAVIGISQGRLSQYLKEAGLREKTILIEQEPQCSN